MGLVMCTSCRGAISSEAKFCSICGAEQGTPEPAQSLASKEANARLAAGKRLRTEDRMILQKEAEARGEHVSGIDKAATEVSIVMKLVWMVFTLIILCVVLYGCAASLLK